VSPARTSPPLFFFSLLPTTTISLGFELLAAKALLGAATNPALHIPTSNTPAIRPKDIVEAPSFVHFAFFNLPLFFLLSD
jgi:hypothetical protein